MKDLSKISNGVNKKISLPIAIIIIVVFGVLVGGIVVWQSWQSIKIPEEPVPKEPISQRQSSKPEEPEEPEEREEAIQPPLLETFFTYPYPVSWRENDIEFSLTGVSLGKITITHELFGLPTPGPSGPFYGLPIAGDYKVGDQIYALVLTLKIKTSQRGVYCMQLNFRRLISEEGDLLTPLNTYFVFPDTLGCQPKTNRTYFNQRVIFIIPETEKEFNITTGGQSNIFFTVTVEDNNLKVERVYPEEPQG